MLTDGLRLSHPSFEPARRTPPMESRLRSLLVVAVVFLAAVAAGCGSDNPSSPNPNGYGTLRVRMTDAPLDVDAVNLVITEVSVRPAGTSDTPAATADAGSATIDASGDWVVLSDGPRTFDLL